MAASMRTICCALWRASSAASEHPLAEAIVEGAIERGLKLEKATEFDSVTGKGATGRVAGHAIAIGNRALLEELEIDPSSLVEPAEALRAEGQTAMFVAVDGTPAGLVSVADPVKASTPEAIEALHGEGLRVVMLTGDSRTTAEAVARRLGIDHVIAEVLPDQKAEAVKKLQGEGAVVAMAGDGINDAPALAQAQVGIAMGTGTDVAMESAGVTLVKGDLRGIVRARRLSPSHHGQHQAEPLLRLRLQLYWRPDCGGSALPVLRPAALADDCRRRNELQLGVGGRQCPPSPAGRNMKLMYLMCRFFERYEINPLEDSK